MQELIKELSEFKVALQINANADFESENNANTEFSEMAAQLQTLIDKHTPTKRSKAIARLGEYLSVDDVESCYDQLIIQAELDGTCPAWTIVDFWEPLEDCGWTVDQLLEQL